MDADKAGLTQVNQSGFPLGFVPLTPDISTHFPIKELPKAIQDVSPHVESFFFFAPRGLNRYKVLER